MRGSLWRRWGLVEFLEFLEPLDFLALREYPRIELSEEPQDELLDEGDDDREPRLHVERDEWQDMLRLRLRNCFGGEGERDGLCSAGRLLFSGRFSSGVAETPLALPFAAAVQ